MQKIGFVGIGKIGFPICDNLIKNGNGVLELASLNYNLKGGFLRVDSGTLSIAG